MAILAEKLAAPVLGMEGVKRDSGVMGAFATAFLLKFFTWRRKKNIGCVKNDDNRGSK